MNVIAVRTASIISLATWALLITGKADTVYLSPSASSSFTPPTDGSQDRPWNSLDSAISAAGSGGEVKIYGGSSVHVPSGQIDSSVTLSVTGNDPVILGAPLHPLAALNFTAAGHGFYDAPFYPGDLTNPFLVGGDVSAHPNGMARIGNSLYLNWPLYDPGTVNFWEDRPDELEGDFGVLLKWRISEGSYTDKEIDITAESNDQRGKPAHMDGAGGGTKGVLAVHTNNDYIRFFDMDLNEFSEAKFSQAGCNTVGISYHPGYDRYFLYTRLGADPVMKVAQDLNTPNPWTNVTVKFNGRGDAMNSGEGGNPFFYMGDNNFGILTLGTSSQPDTHDEPFSLRATCVVIEQTQSGEFEAILTILPETHELSAPYEGMASVLGIGDYPTAAPSFRWAGTAFMSDGNGNLEIRAAPRGPTAIALGYGGADPERELISKWQVFPN